MASTQQETLGKPACLIIRLLFFGFGSDLSNPTKMKTNTETAMLYRRLASSYHGMADTGFLFGGF